MYACIIANHLWIYSFCNSRPHLRPLRPARATLARTQVQCISRPCFPFPNNSVHCETKQASYIISILVIYYNLECHVGCWAKIGKDRLEDPPGVINYKSQNSIAEQHARETNKSLIFVKSTGNSGSAVLFVLFLFLCLTFRQNF